jgi:8-oxo-dGTP pyrophosphatase MutT (NUDIX family)
MDEIVRAVLVTPRGRLLVIERVWPGAQPYWVLPGGHVEPEDADLRAALAREVFEETGGHPRTVGLLGELNEERRRLYFYLARIDSWSEADRTGPEFTDPDRGEYRLTEVPLTPEALDPLALVPEAIAEFVRDAVRAGRDLAELADPSR